MAIHDTIYQIMANDAGITALTSAIFPIEIPQASAAPAIAYARTSSTHRYTHSGHNSLRESNFEIACFARKAKDAVALADAVVACFKDYNTAPVNQAFIRGEVNTYDTQTELHVTLVLVTIWHVGA